MDYTWTPGPDPPNNQDGGIPRAIFIPHSNSLPFEERRVTLEQPVKVNSFLLISMLQMNECEYQVDMNVRSLSR